MRALRAADPLRHRRLWHQEGRSDLARREPADGAQGERDRRGIAERGMAAEEEEQQRVVGAGRLRPVRLEQLGVLLATPARTLAAQLRRPSAARRPGSASCAGCRAAPLGPLARGRDERLLHGVLGGVEVVVAPHERAEDLRRELAQQALGGAVELSRRRQVGRPPRSGGGSRACSRPDPRRRPAGRRPSRACSPLNSTPRDRSSEWAASKSSTWNAIGWALPFASRPKASDCITAIVRLPVSNSTPGIWPQRFSSGSPSTSL